MKFYNKFPGDNEDEKRKNCYEKWLDTISSDFGVCKHESASPFGESHQLSYQIVNSLPLSKDEIHELLKDELKHIDNMKNDVSYFKSTLNFEDPVPSDALMLMLFEVNDKMWHTKMVKDYVRDKVDNYIANLRKGHIKVKGSDYAVLFGNPIEMLQYAMNKEEMKERPLEGKQIYCSRYANGEKLAGFRNPHITMGNVLFVENIEKEEFKIYFNLTKNIVISNAYDNDIMDRLQGQDYDSDTLLLCSESILVKAAEACQNDNFRVPINGIKAENKKRKYTIKEEVEIDHTTARNKIGEIVNLSQLLNSYYWDWNSRNDNGQYDGLLKEYYTLTSILSSLSQIEIDRAKKDYSTETDKFLKTLRERKYNGELLLRRGKERFKKDKLKDDDSSKLSLLKRVMKKGSLPKEIFRILYPDGQYNEEDVVNGQVLLDKEKIKELQQWGDKLLISDEENVLVRPNFFEYCAKGKRYLFKPFNTPMDFLQEIINKDIPDKERTPTVDILDIIPKPDFRKADNHQIPQIRDACAKANKDIKTLQSNQKMSDETRYPQIRQKEDEVIQNLKKLKINDNTIRIILYRAFSENEKYYKKEYGEMKRNLASWLYKAHPETFKQVIEMSKSK
jgi:hypothetical protein